MARKKRPSPKNVWVDLVLSDRGPALEDGRPAPITRYVLYTLSKFANADGESCHPSTRKLASATGLTERTVCTHLEAGEQKGWIRRRLRATGHNWRLTHYTLRIPADVLNQLQQEAAERLSARSGEGAEPDAQRAERGAEGTERDDDNLLKDVQSISSGSSSVNSSRSLRAGARGDSGFEQRLEQQRQRLFANGAQP